MYKNEVDKPMQAHKGSHPKNDYGCMDFKGQAMDQAYGQSGKAGLKADMRKIHAQHFHSYSDDSSGHEA